MRVVCKIPKYRDQCTSSKIVVVPILYIRHAATTVAGSETQVVAANPSLTYTLRHFDIHISVPQALSPCAQSLMCNFTYDLTSSMATCIAYAQGGRAYIFTGIFMHRHYYREALSLPSALARGSE